MVVHACNPGTGKVEAENTFKSLSSWGECATQVQYDFFSKTAPSFTYSLSLGKLGFCLFVYCCLVWLLDSSLGVEIVLHVLATTRIVR